MGASQRKRRRERQRTHRFWAREISREFRYFAVGNAVHPGIVAVATIAGEWFPYVRCDRGDGTEVYHSNRCRCDRSLESGFHMIVAIAASAEKKVQRS